MKTSPFLILLLPLVALGVFFGYRLSLVPNLRPYLLANTVGLLFNLLAVFVLSELLVSSTNWKEICVKFIAPTLLWATIAVPVGVSVGAGIGWLLGRQHSASIVGKFALSMFAYGTLVGGLLQPVVLPRALKLDVETRWRYFGLILLATGMLLQLYSSIAGL
jgi:hypothetical protein